MTTNSIIFLDTTETEVVEHPLLAGPPGVERVLPHDLLAICQAIDMIISDPDKLNECKDLTESEPTYRFPMPCHLSMNEINRIGSLYQIAGWGKSSVEMTSDEVGKRSYVLILTSNPGD